MELERRMEEEENKALLKNPQLFLKDGIEVRILSTEIV
jgi:hypothetical protein